MKILAITTTLSARYGGAVSAAVEICLALSKRHTVSLWTTDLDIAYAYQEIMDRCEVRIFKALPGTLSFCPRMSEAMARIGHFDSVHVFGLWTYPSVCALQAYRQSHGNPCLFVHSQGLLLPTAFGHHRFRKEIASRLFFRKATAAIAGFIACNDVEVDHIRNWAEGVPIYVLPNLVASRYVKSGAFRSRHGVPEGVPIVGYLNRFHPIKRVKELCDAFFRMQRRNTNIRFVLAGDLSNAYGQAVFARAAEIGLNADFVGHLADDEKWEFLADCTVLCQFSLQEGHSVAILEALAAGVPVIISPGCNAPEVARRHAGKIVADVDEMANAALEVVENDLLREEMSKNAKRLIADEYSADKWVRQFEGIMSINSRSSSNSLEKPGRWNDSSSSANRMPSAPYSG